MKLYEFYRIRIRNTAPQDSVGFGNLQEFDQAEFFNGNPGMKKYICLFLELNIF